MDNTVLENRYYPPVGVISYRRFRTIFGPILRVQERRLGSSNYHYSLRNHPEERSSHLLRGGNLTSRSSRVSACQYYYSFKIGHDPLLSYPYLTTISHLSLRKQRKCEDRGGAGCDVQGSPLHIFFTFC